MPTVIDKEFEEPVYSPVCSLCRHFLGWKEGERRGHCSAFPDGIPVRIWRGEHTHRTAYPGDHGIRFEPLEGR